jgi:carboxymethylenebutenolidase
VTQTGRITGEILCLFGEQDPLIPLTQVDRIEAALKTENISHTVVRYPQVGHGFFCDQRADYNAPAATDAWERTLSLFARRLQPSKVQ